MLKALQIANVVLTAIGATFAVTLAVVAIMLAFYVDAYPRYADTLVGVIRVAGLSAVIFFAGGLCVVSLRQRWMLWPALHVAGWGIAGVVIFVMLRMLGV